VASGHYPPAPDSARALPLLARRGSASLTAFKGQVLVLNFWASWCEPCRREAPLLERFQPSLRATRGTVLGVSYLDASSDSRAFVRSYHLSFPELRDGDGTFAHSYGTNQLPESFIIDRAGRVVAVSTGRDRRALPLARARPRPQLVSARPLAPLAALALLGGPAGAVAPAAPRASLPAIERQVMCVTCKIPLNLAASPQADRERAFIQGLIARGQSEAQIKRALVAEYGRAVLALPSSGGFGVFAYAVPLAVVIGLAAALAVLLPRWRARQRTSGEEAAPRPALSAEDSARLDADMARFDWVVDAHRERFGVEPICRALGVSASAYHQRANGQRSVDRSRTSARWR